MERHVEDLKVPRLVINPADYLELQECKQAKASGYPQDGRVFWYRSFHETKGNYRLVNFIFKMHNLNRGEFYLAIPVGVVWRETARLDSRWGWPKFLGKIGQRVARSWDRHWRKS